METTLNLKVTGKYMGQEYAGTIISAFDTSSYIEFTVTLDAPITVFALGKINSFTAKYNNGELNSTRQTIINLV